MRLLRWAFELAIEFGIRSDNSAASVKLHKLFATDKAIAQSGLELIDDVEAEIHQRGHSGWRGLQQPLKIMVLRGKY